jgi:hypothetical protein
MCYSTKYRSATLSDVVPALKGCGIQLLDIEVGNLDIEAIKVDATVDNRIEHKCVIGAWRDGQTYFSTLHR